MQHCQQSTKAWLTSPQSQVQPMTRRGSTQDAPTEQLKSANIRQVTSQPALNVASGITHPTSIFTATRRPQPQQLATAAVLPPNASTFKDMTGQEATANSCQRGDGDIFKPLRIHPS